MNDEIAFNINFYEKYHELEILVEILRQEFGDEVYINVLCNDTGRDPSSLERLQIDNFEIEETFSLEESKEDITDRHKHKLLQLRMIDQFTTGLNHCARESGADYTMNLHADAWPLSRDSVESILSELDQNDCPFGSRGYGWGYTSSGSPYGFIMDIFFVVHNRTVRDTNVFEFDPENLLVTLPNIHGTLASMIHFRYGADGIHWYSDLTETLNWDEQQKQNVGSAMVPLVYEPGLDLLHFNTDQFLDDYGYRFMSKYLEAYGFTSGEAIEQHLSEYPAGDDLVTEYGQILADHPLLKWTPKYRRHEMSTSSIPEEYTVTDQLKYAIRALAGRSSFLSDMYNLVQCYRSEIAGPDFLERKYTQNMEFFTEVARQLDEEPPLEGVNEIQIGTLKDSSRPIFRPTDRSEHQQSRK